MNILDLDIPESTRAFYEARIKKISHEGLFFTDADWKQTRSPENIYQFLLLLLFDFFN